MSTFDALQPVPEYWHKMVLCSHLEYPICNGAILLHFALLDAILKLKLSMGVKTADDPGAIKNDVYTGTWCPLN